MSTTTNQAAGATTPSNEWTPSRKAMVVWFAIVGTALTAVEWWLSTTAAPHASEIVAVQEMIFRWAVLLTAAVFLARLEGPLRYLDGVGDYSPGWDLWTSAYKAAVFAIPAAGWAAAFVIVLGMIPVMEAATDPATTLTQTQIQHLVAYNSLALVSISVFGAACALTWVAQMAPEPGRDGGDT